MCVVYVMYVHVYCNIVCIVYVYVCVVNIYYL
nr:MAG TPA: hypothetical protein [Caudoviricetes sp.]